jgi:hypothetical protein
MTKVNDLNRKVAEVSAPYRKLIIDADVRTLRLLAKGGGIGVRTYESGSAGVCVTRGSTQNPLLEIDLVESYLETPHHSLSIGDEYGSFCMRGCQAWLDSHGLGELNIAELAQTWSGDALKRRVEDRLLSHPRVAHILKSEMLDELSEVIADYADLVSFEFTFDGRNLATAH